MDFGAAAQPALLLARRVERRDRHPGRRTQRPSDAQARGQPPRVLRHHRSSGPDAAAGRALSVRRVAPDYHVEVQGHFYSVPSRLIRQVVEVRATETTIEVFHRGTRIASHARSGVKHRHTTIPEHMPSAHRRYAFWTPARLLPAAEKIGPSTVALCEAIMRTKPHPEQGFRSCLGILRMEK